MRRVGAFRLVRPLARVYTGRKMVYYSIGHSTRTLEELLGMLEAAGVRALADIRTMPRSRHVPHFNIESLGPALKSRGIEYSHIKDLGGFRKARPDSRNLGWENKSFRGYADYMETEGFDRGLAALSALAGGRGPAAFMCAEVLPHRCHRRLVSDALTARGDEVIHLLGPGRSEPHRLTEFARVRDGKVTYPADEFW